MFRTLFKALAAIAVVCTVGGMGLVGYEEFIKPDARGTRSEASLGDPFTGTKKIPIDGRSVTVSCTGDASHDGPLVLLMAGGGDGLETMAPLGRSLSKKSRVCSYDRLGEGTSDKPDGPQSIDDSSAVLTSVLDRLAGERPDGP